MTPPIRSLAIAGALALIAAAAHAQDMTQPAPEAMTGLKVGEKAPRFSLKDQEGEERSLDGLLKKGKVALVFLRSAEW